MTQAFYLVRVSIDIYYNTNNYSMYTRFLSLLRTYICTNTRAFHFHCIYVRSVAE